MAVSRAKLHKESFSCPICLDLLKDPVTISCGHSYCMDCINTHWDGQDGHGRYTCPQCRHQCFYPRPDLEKNTMLAVLMEGLKKSGPSVALVSHCYAAHGDVTCDLCSGRKLKAVKSCLQCLVSYCKHHLQPHYDVAALKKHKLVDPTDNLRDSICSRHDEVMKMFCRTDQQCICYLCSLDDHKGHDTVTAAAERSEREKVLDGSKQKILHKIDVKEKVLHELQQKVNNVSHTEMVQKENHHRELAHFIVKRMTQVKLQVRALQKAEEHRVKELQDKLQQEITELQRKQTELDKLTHTKDHYQFLHNFVSLLKINDEPHSSKMYEAQLPFQYMVAVAAKELRDQLQDPEKHDKPQKSEKEVVPSTDRTSCKAPEQKMDNSTNILHIFAPDTPMSVPRDELLQYACDVTLDPNTNHVCIALSAGNRKATRTSKTQSQRKHPERFTRWCQVLSKEALPSCCYIEMNVKIEEMLTIAVAYKDIQRKGPFDACCFENSENSWALVCYSAERGIFWHKEKSMQLKIDCNVTKIGIFLRHETGILAFYKLNEPKNLMHEIHTTFTKPLYLGIGFDDGLDSVEICKLV